MRVLCETLDEFFQDLDAHFNVIESALRFSIATEEAEGRSTVYAQASALVCSLQVGYPEYLLQVGLPCGKDYQDADGEDAGTKQAEEYRQRVETYASSRGWRVLPGVPSF